MTLDWIDYMGFVLIAAAVAEFLVEVTDIWFCAFTNREYISMRDRRQRER